MTGQQIGYRRVSTVDQNLGRQLEGVRADRVFEDKLSGKDRNRPQLEACMAYCREGDTLVVHSMDRLARNLTDLRQMVEELTRRGVIVRFEKENLTFTGEKDMMANLLMNMLGAVAEFERDMILERQREGIALAKAACKYKGRRKALAGAQIVELRKRALAGESKTDLAAAYGVSRETIYAYLRA